MNKRIMLTIIGICAILTFVGCENGKKIEISETESLMNTENQEEQKNEEKVSVPEVYHYNESGKIIIAMYHKFTSRERERRVD